MAATSTRPEGAETREPHPSVERAAGVGRLVPARAHGWRVARGFLSRALDRYPALPPAPRGRRARIGLAVVTLLALAYTIFFVAYLFTLHDAYLTHAEDLGIMDQALWNTTHGALLRQTVCNIVTDTNCLGDVSRFAIHFEPILLPLALLYRFVPSPKTLQLLQVVIVAAGAFPAYWLASRRLRSVLAGVVFAALYLLYPALQAAVTFDFHAVTLAAAFLMFALYFLLARNDVGLVVACVLALATKEEIVVDVAMIGLSAALLQRRWRLGGGLVALALGWLVVELAIMHAASPLGHPPTASRYAALGSSPTQVAVYLLTHPGSVLRSYVFEPRHLYYLRSLLAPVGYLPLLSPLTLLMAAPALAINLLSNNAAMYSGVYQYSADIVPVLLLAAIESVALLVGVGARLAARAAPRVEGMLWRRPQRAARWAARLRADSWPRALSLGLVMVVLISGLRAQRLHGYLPITQGFAWPHVTAHARIADTLARLIPPDASVSAQSDLVPHVSQRRAIYLFPYQEHEAQYLFLDVTGNLYPQLPSSTRYAQGIRELLASGQYTIVAARDGYLLLKRASRPGPALQLPASFYSFTEVAPREIPHTLAIRFGASLELIGYKISPSGKVYSGEVFLNTPYLTVTTYWRVTGPVAGNPWPEVLLTLPNGRRLGDAQFATIQWRPMSAWPSGKILAVRSWPQLMDGSEVGTVRVGVRVLADAPGGGDAQPLPALPLAPVGPRGAAPTLLDGGTEAVFADVHVAG
ncbi:MAG: DUF2079 domain-containing protein [Ktedonobacterales bacterium]|nr:DUF2079 domain-containing protein [Ktedonobacterales bacterium]